VILDADVAGRTLRVEVRGRGPRYSVTVDGRRFEVDVHETSRHFLSLLIEGRSYEVGLERRGQGFRVVLSDDILQVDLRDATRGAAPAVAGASGPARVTAPMPGKIVRLLVSAGQQVEAGDALVVIEAMKMENELRAPRDGRVVELSVQEGQAVEAGTPLAIVG